MKPEAKQKYSIEFFREDYCYNSEQCKEPCCEAYELTARRKQMKPTICTLLANALVCSYQKIKSVMTHKK